MKAKKNKILKSETDTKSFSLQNGSLISDKTKITLKVQFKKNIEGYITFYCNRIIFTIENEEIFNQEVNYNFQFNAELMDFKEIFTLDREISPFALIHCSIFGHFFQNDTKKVVNLILSNLDEITKLVFDFVLKRTNLNGKDKLTSIYKNGRYIAKYFGKSIFYVLNINNSI